MKFTVPLVYARKCTRSAASSILCSDEAAEQRGAIGPPTTFEEKMAALDAARAAIRAVQDAAAAGREEVGGWVGGRGDRVCIYRTGMDGFMG